MNDLSLPEKVIQHVEVLVLDQVQPPYLIVANDHYEEIYIYPYPIYDTYALIDGTNTYDIAGVPPDENGTPIFAGYPPGGYGTAAISVVPSDSPKFEHSPQILPPITSVYEGVTVWCL